MSFWLKVHRFCDSSIELVFGLEGIPKNSPWVLFKFNGARCSIFGRTKNSLDWKVRFFRVFFLYLIEIYWKQQLWQNNVRIWWAIAISLSVILCIFGVWNIWEKWQQRPVIVSFNDKTTSIGMIPFPAVTICSTRKFDLDKVNVPKFVENFGNIEKNQTFLSVASKE